jgi:hypothetical protein
VDAVRRVGDTASLSEVFSVVAVLDDRNRVGSCVASNESSARGATYPGTDGGSGECRNLMAMTLRQCDRGRS